MAYWDFYYVIIVHKENKLGYRSQLIKEVLVKNFPHQMYVVLEWANRYQQ